MSITDLIIASEPPTTCMLMSDITELKFGLTQDSVFETLIFLSIINDLSHFLNTQTIMYADNTTLVNFNL